MLYLFASAVLLFFFYLLWRWRNGLSGSRLPTYLLSLAAAFLTLSLVRFPKEAFEASVAGLDIWWNIVFPALLPFFIFAQLLIGLGVVHAMGVFLEPVMRPVFNVPGAGSFVMAMGLASGFPIGSVLTSELRSKELCSQVEAERLLSFTNTADPLFMFGAVSVGMLGYPEAGITIAVAHYFSSLSLGLLFRFYKRGEVSTPLRKTDKSGVISRALKALLSAREDDGRPLGRLLGDSIHKSINTLMLIGGFIILFSVIIKILDLMGVVGFFAGGFTVALNLTGLSVELAPALVSGLLEIDLGCQFTAFLDKAPMNDKIIALSMIIAWSGLSVHAQVASIISGTDIRIAPYLVSRFIHAVLAGLFTALLLGPLSSFIGYATVPAFISTDQPGGFSLLWARMAFMCNGILYFFGFLGAAAALFYLARSIFRLMSSRHDFR